MPRKTCAVCREPVSPPSGRFCPTHKREHADVLLTDLAKIGRCNCLCHENGRQCGACEPMHRKGSS